MHCELVVPALFATREIPRLPSLELLLARGRAAQAERRTPEAWLAGAFELDQDSLPAGALTALAERADASGPDIDASWLRADPVHLRLGSDRLVLIPSAGFHISREEADALVATLDLHFGPEFAFVAARPDCWCLRTAAEVELQALAPLELAGQDVDANLPLGPDAARWHALMNEIQMALHDHPVNLAREQRGEPAVNSVWFWGAGPLPATAHGPWQSITADEPVAAGLAKLAGMRHRPVPEGAREWLGRTPEEGRHLVMLDTLRGAIALGDEESHSGRLAALEAAWFAPLLEALRGGRVGMVTVRAPDSGMSCETVRGDLRRFWRRARPLGVYA